MLDLLSTLFGPRIRLPRDVLTRVPRSARKAARESIDGMQAALDKIAALPGLADIATTKRAPKGLYGLIAEWLQHYDGFLNVVGKQLGLEDAKRPGSPGGCSGCYAAPTSLSSLEALYIYRKVRPWQDFPKVAKSLAEMAEQQFKDIQAHHQGKDPEKIRLGGKAVQKGRQMFAKRGRVCPFLDEGRQRCRIWEQRPINCRMHFVLSNPDFSDPRHEQHDQVKAKNIRLPIRQQVTVSQIDKRMGLQLAPFMYASLLQLVQLNGSEPINEVGESPQRVQRDGTLIQRANRNVPGAKKYQKKSKSKARKK